MENENFDTLQVSAAIKPAIGESEKEVAEYADFEGEDDLYKEVVEPQRMKRR
ncbi:MAG: hypothetical protein U5L96_14360 [Owenweeksia sp.]|nr:hypothetical protein [Owenweeksia sp.]